MIKPQTPKLITIFLRSFSSSSSSTSTSPRNKYHNYYLRKRRKWPHPIYKSRWHQKLSQQNAMQTLHQQLSLSPPKSPLLCLTYSYSLHNSNPTPNAYHFIIKYLIQTSQSQHILPLLTHLEEHESFETPESIFIDLIEFYGRNHEFQHAIDVFFRLDKFRCVPSVEMLNCLVLILCKRKEGFVVVPQVLLKSRLMNIRLDERTFVVLIKALCRFGKPVNAIGLLCHMVENGIEIDRSSFSLILLMLCRLKNVDCNEVMRLVEEMRGFGFCFGFVDWMNVIWFLARRGKGMEALEAFREMKFVGFKPNVICYTLVLDGVISEGEYKCAERLFDEMLVHGLVPDINTYNVYVKGLCKQKKFDDGFKMLSCMEEIGCSPNMITYNTLLGAMYESGELGVAEKFLEQVKRKGVMLNSQTYEIMIARMVDTDDISKALDLVEEMMQKGLMPESATFDEILCKLCKSGFVLKALNMLMEMLGKNAIPGCRSWEALINGFQVKHDFKEIN